MRLVLNLKFLNARLRGPGHRERVVRRCLLLLSLCDRGQVQRSVKSPVIASNPASRLRDNLSRIGSSPSTGTFGFASRPGNLGTASEVSLELVFV